MKLYLLSICLLFSAISFGQSADETTIRKMLMKQEQDWNKGDITAFVDGYWKSDSLMFIGSNGVTYGFNNTWERYKKNYDSREKMGTLHFDLLHLISLANDVYMVVGKWHLTRTIGDIGGHYTLILRKINGNWLIVSDHTS